jgi:hypothetical protein
MCSCGAALLQKVAELLRKTVIAEMRICSCRETFLSKVVDLEVPGLLKKIRSWICRYTVAEQHFLTKLWISFVEVVAVADIKKKVCKCPPLHKQV